jgi:hypothetical protein
MDNFLRGNGHNFMSWFVSEKTISLSEVEKIVDRHTGNIIWDGGDYSWRIGMALAKELLRSTVITEHKAAG